MKIYKAVVLYSTITMTLLFICTADMLETPSQIFFCLMCNLVAYVACSIILSKEDLRELTLADKFDKFLKRHVHNN